MKLDLSKAILFGGEIDHEKVAGLGDYLVSHPKDGLVIFNSEGGSITEGFAMYDLARLTSSNLTTIVIGQCESIAILPFLAGITRYCSEHSVFCIHHGSWNPEESFHQRELPGIVQELIYLDDCYQSIISRHTKLSIKQVKDLMTHGHYFNAKEALKMGFVHKIL